MAKNKKNKDIKNSNKNVLSDEQINIIIEKTNEIINKLENDKKSILKTKKTKLLINNQINDLKRFLEQEQYYLLKDKIDALEEMEKKEQSKINEEIALEHQKSPKKKINFQSIINSIKTFDRWPLYSRIKRISQTYEGAEKTKRIAFFVSIFVLLIITMIIGILLIANVIPYVIYQDTTKIGPWIIFSLPLAALFFI